MISVRPRTTPLLECLLFRLEQVAESASRTLGRLQISLEPRRHAIFRKAGSSMWAKSIPNHNDFPLLGWSEIVITWTHRLFPVEKFFNLKG
jgi:hypothetical protein